MLTKQVYSQRFFFIFVEWNEGYTLEQCDSISVIINRKFVDSFITVRFIYLYTITLEVTQSVRDSQLSAEYKYTFKNYAAITFNIFHWNETEKLLLLKQILWLRFVTLSKINEELHFIHTAWVEALTESSSSKF